MKTFRQIGVVTTLNFKSLPSRFWSSLVIVVGMACVVGVLLSMLSFVAGLVGAFNVTGDPQRVLITSKDSASENPSNIPRASVPIIQDAPGIMKYKDGTPFSDASLLITVPAYRKENHLAGNVVLRGWGPKGAPLRPEMKMIAGRMFQPGKRELIVGVGARSQFEGFELGQKVLLPDGEWPIVGIFDSNGTTLDGCLIADAEPAMAAVRRNYFSAVLLRLDPAPDSFGKLKKALTSNPAISVRVERHTEYYTRQNEGFAPLQFIAYFVGGIMAVGAIFGALNTMYAAVSNRTREIATLRALGFGAVPVAVSVITESIVLAFIGAVIGTAIAWLLYNGAEDLNGATYFRMAVTPALVSLGLIWAMVIALIGGLFPSIRAARQSIVAGLRAT